MVTLPGDGPGQRPPRPGLPSGPKHAGGTLRAWQRVHTWTSLACTAFLLMLCVTGLPLVFEDEIGQWLDEPPPAAPQDAAATQGHAPWLSLDRLVEAARARAPRDRIRFIGPDWERGAVYIGLGPTPEPGPGGYALKFDARNARLLEDSRDPPPAGALRHAGQDAMALLRDLHAELLLDDAGEWILCAMGVLFLAALVSGAVLYAPYMRKLPFGALRRNRAPRLYWLDLHNLAGMAVLAWALAVGATGAFNTLSGQLFGHWQAHTVQALTAGYRGQGDAPVVTGLFSIQAAVDLAHRTRPDMRVGTIVYPNRDWVSPHHYLLFAWGDTPLTSQLRVAFLIDARTGALTAAEPLPWYLQGIELSRPLHFGDYGGLPLKALWAALDLVLIAVLASGLYLYAARLRLRRRGASEAAP